VIPLEKVGSILAISGSTLSIIGALINNIWLDHIGAMGIWMFSNILLLAWAWGYDKEYWNGGLSAKALVAMYLVFTVSNVYGLFILGAA
jgi:hypothetical protein